MEDCRFMYTMEPRVLTELVGEQDTDSTVTLVLDSQAYVQVNRRYCWKTRSDSFFCRLRMPCALLV